MCVVIKSRPEFKVGHVGSKTRSLGQFLEKPCVLSRRHSFDPVFMKLCQNDFLTLNKHLSRRAMLSDDSSCFACLLSMDQLLKKRICSFRSKFFPSRVDLRAHSVSEANRSSCKFNITLFAERGCCIVVLRPR